jgi:outer membrane usher protein FimD/PapC
MSSATAAPAAKASWRLSFPASPYIPRVGLAAEWRGRDFSVPTADGSGSEGLKDPVLTLSAQVSQSLPARLGAVSAYADSSLVGGRADSFIAQLGYFLTTRGYVSFSANYGVEWRYPGTTEPRASFVVAWTPPGAPSIQYRNDPTSKVDSLDASMVLGPDGAIGLGAHYSSLAWAAGGDRSAGFTGRFSGDTLAASTALFYESSDDMDTTSLMGDLSASTSLALAGRRFAFGNPRSESFAILAPSDELSGTRIALRSADGPLTESDEGRATLIRGLRLYRPFLATVELPTSDADLMPYPATISLVPGYKTVTVVKVALASSVSISGVAIDAAGMPLVGLSGDILNDEGMPIENGGTFTDEVGYFECYGLGEGRHTIRLSDGSVIRFSVPEGMTKGTLDLGIVVAENPDRGKGGLK